ncbi:MAG: hypothetical protein ACOYKA_04890 [Legionellaceae bacterium]
MITNHSIKTMFSIATVCCSLVLLPVLCESAYANVNRGGKANVNRGANGNVNRGANANVNRGASANVNRGANVNVNRGANPNVTRGANPALNNATVNQYYVPAPYNNAPYNTRVPAGTYYINNNACLNKCLLEFPTQYEVYCRQLCN